MRQFFLIDIDLKDVIGEDKVSEEKLEKWFQEHKERFIQNLYEHARNEIKYFIKELYPIEE